MSRFVTRDSYERAVDPITGKCRRCGGDLRMIGTGRSLWVRPFAGGFGEVAAVSEVFCPSCDSEPVPPSYRTPIYDDELVERRRRWESLGERGKEKGGGDG